MSKLIALPFTLGLATSAQAMPISPTKQPDGFSHSCVKRTARACNELIMSAGATRLCVHVGPDSAP
jgi:hypothetical protein